MGLSSRGRTEGACHLLAIELQVADAEKRVYNPLIPYQYDAASRRKRGTEITLA